MAIILIIEVVTNPGKICENACPLAKPEETPYLSYLDRLYSRNSQWGQKSLLNCVGIFICYPVVLH